MLRKLIGWALDNPLIVIVMVIGLMGFGIHSFREVNVEAYPDPRRRSLKSSRNFPAHRPRKWNGRLPSLWK